MNRIALAIAAIAASGCLAGTAVASTFVAWRVAGLTAGDLLNVRAYPSPKSKVLVGYPEGTTLSMTGRCTGGVDLGDIAGLPQAQQRELVRYRWCEAWLDPSGSGTFRQGWVYGRYIRPN